MLTNEVTNIVDNITSINNQISQLSLDLEANLVNLKKLILSQHPDDTLDYFDIVGAEMVDIPNGTLQADGSYAMKQCSDSLYAPDSGDGTIFYPVADGRWLRVDYIW